MEDQNINKCERIFNDTIGVRQQRLSKKFENFNVIGTIDGASNTYVYEVKTRQSNMNDIYYYEMIQLMWYCYIKRLPGRLVSFCGDQHMVWECSLDIVDGHVKKHLPYLIDLFTKPVAEQKSSCRRHTRGTAAYGVCLFH